MQELSWRAHFNDGRILTRENVTYYELNRDGLVKFELADPQGNTVITIDASEGKQPFYRRYDSIPVGFPPSYIVGWRTRFPPFYIVGWRTKTAQKMYVIDDTGIWELPYFHDKWYEPDPWFPTEQV